MTQPQIELKALVDFANRPYDSRIEEKWVTSGNIYLQDFFNATCIRTDYQPITFNLPGPIQYTPDFLHILADGRVIICEIKNSPKNKGHQTTLNKIKTAQEIYPYFIYIIVYAELGWEIRRIGEAK